MPVKLQMPPPNPKQKAALEDGHRYVGYGGARGGGKSWFVRWKATLLCLRFSGIQILITRRTYKELQNNHIIPLQKMLEGVAEYRKGDKCFLFPNGSAIYFGYCDKETDLTQYQGAEYDVWFADEAGQMPESWLVQIDACVRGVNNFPKRTYYTLNPGGASHGYFKRLFIDRRFTDDEYPEDYSFIQALAQDNTVLMQQQPEYLRALEKLPTALRKAWLNGEWDVFEGQFFEDFVDRPEHYKDRRFTHVIEPFEIPAHWRIYRSFDWGYSRPFSCGWWAMDTEGTAYRILELYGCTEDPNTGVRWVKEKVFAEIHRIETEHRWLAGKQIQGVADPAIWDAQTGESIAETAEKYQVYFEPGDHKRLPGWMQVHTRLAFDENGIPQMYVFRNCKAFIRTIPLLEYDPHKPEDIDTEGEDHVADEVRYFCMMHPLKAKLPEVKDEYSRTGAALYLDVPKSAIRRSSRMSGLTIIEED